MAIDINIPSQVKTYADLASFPATGSLKTIFIAEDTNKTYRWTGTAYVEVSAAGATGITIGTTAITSGTVGRVLFEGTGNVVQESANLFWDNTNARLGVGIAVPTSKLHIKFNGALTSGIDIDSTAFNTNHLSFSKDGVMRGQIGMNDSSGEIRYFCGAGGYYPTFWSNNNERMRIHASTGNVGINTATDAGFKLDVNGTARVASTVGQTLIVQSSLDSSFTSIAEFNASGLSTSRTGFVAIGRNGATNNQASLGFYYDGNASNSNRLDFGFYGTTPRMSILAGGNVGIGTSTPTSKLYIKQSGDGSSDGLIMVGLTNASTARLYVNGSGLWTFNRGGTDVMGINTTGNILIGTTTDAGYKLDVNGTARVNTIPIGLGGGQVATNTTVGITALSGNTSGSLNTSFGYTALAFNQTGGSNTAVGFQSGYGNTTGSNNTSIGRNSLITVANYSDNTAVGAFADCAGFSGCTILGKSAVATANNQFVVGSTTTNAGAVTSEVNASTQVWNVVINGVARKILLA